VGSFAPFFRSRPPRDRGPAAGLLRLDFRLPDDPRDDRRFARGSGTGAGASTTGSALSPRRFQAASSPADQDRSRVRRPRGPKVSTSSDHPSLHARTAPCRAVQ